MMCIGTDRRSRVRGRLRAAVYGLAATVGLTVLITSVAFAQDGAGPSQAALREFNGTAALQNSGFYARAGEKWLSFIQKYPGDERLPQVHYYLGICQLQTDRHAEAIHTFQTVLSKYPQFDQADGAQFNLGMAQFEVAALSKKPEDHTTAAKTLDVVTEKYPQSTHAAKARYFQAESLYAAGDVEAAVTVYQELVQFHKDSPLAADGYYALGVALQALARPDQAVTTYQAFLATPALAKHELAAEIRLRRAIALHEQGKVAEAEEAFAEVAAMPDVPFADFALLRQGECLLESDRAEEAVQRLAELPKRFPESSYVRSSQMVAGKAYVQLQKFDEAVKSLTSVAAAQPDEISAEASYWLGRTLLQQNKATEAFQHLDGAAKTYHEGPFAPYIALTRINAVFELPDRRKDAALLYAEFAKRHPNHPLRPQALYMAGLAALEGQDYTTAQTQSKSFLEDNALAEHPLMPEMIFVAAESQLLAQEQNTGGDLAQAEQLYRRLVTKYPDHEHASRSHLRIGWCLYQTEKHAEALAYLNGQLPQFVLPEQKAEAQLVIGRCHSATGEYQQAFSAFDAALQAKPDWTRADEALLAAGRSLHMMGKHAEAIQRFSLLINTYPQSEYLAHATFELGEIAEQQEKLDEAIGHFRTVAEKFPQSELVAPAHYGLASAFFAQEKYADSVASSTRLLNDHADSPIAMRTRYLRGLAYQRSGQFQEAVGDLQAFVASKPDGEALYDARYALALCQAGMKAFDQAITTLAGLLSEKPDFAHADKVRYEIGHALVAVNKPTEAAEAFRSLAEKSPQSPLAPESWFRVGQFHEESADALEPEQARQDQFGKAAEAYAAGATLESPPELREKLRYKLGDMQFRLQRYELVADTLGKQIQDHPEGELASPARFLMAESLFRLQRAEQALPLFMHVVQAKVEPYEAQALYRCGACAGQLKRWTESQTHYTALIRRFPDFSQLAEAQYGLGLALQNQSNLAEARKAYEQVTLSTETETAAKARFMIGELAFAEKEFEEAIEHFIMVTVGYPYKEWQALAQFETGRCFIELDQKEKGIATFKRLIDQFPDHPKAKDAMQLINKLSE